MGRRFSPREIRRFQAGVRIVRDGVDGSALIDARPALEEYAWLHEKSAAQALSLLAEHLSPGPAPRVLELGGAPYFFTALMRWAFGAEVTPVNVEAGAWPGAAATQTRGSVILAVPESSGAEGRLELEVQIFNVERDPFPFEPASFDVVLCMEVLEHLGYNPSHMLAEAHRVLRPGGILLITVPNHINVKRWVNLFFNRSTEFPYSGYGIYGRHQREFAPEEVRRLLEACGYAVENLTTANVWPTFRDHVAKGMGNAVLNWLTDLPVPWLAAKREMVLCVARAVGTPVAAYPRWLYEHRHLYPEPREGIAKVISG